MNAELLLWRWSTFVQLSSLLMIAVFFALLGRRWPARRRVARGRRGEVSGEARRAQET